MHSNATGAEAAFKSEKKTFHKFIKFEGKFKCALIHWTLKKKRGLVRALADRMV
jgi:hypothetical protein